MKKRKQKIRNAGITVNPPKPPPVFFVQIAVEQCDTTGKATFLALDTCGRVYFYDQNDPGWYRLEKDDVRDPKVWG